MPDELPRLLDEQEVAAALGLSVSTLQRLIEDGEFPDAIPVSSKTRKWHPQDVLAYLYLRGRIGAKKVGDPVNPIGGSPGGQAGVRRGSDAK